MDLKTGAILFLASLLVLARPGCGYKRQSYNLHHISAGQNQRNGSSDYDTVSLFASLNFPDHLHVLVLYTEDYTEAVESISKKFHSLSGGLTFLRYDGTLTTLEVFFHLASPSTVLVPLCSPVAVVDIFQTMKGEHLRFHLMSFLVILKRESADVVGILEDLVHEGILVKILLEESGGGFGIFLPHVNANGSVRFINKGNWSTTRIAMSKNLVEPNRLSQKYSVNGRHMRVAGKDAWPAFKLGKILPDGTIEPESGVDAYILRALSSTLNFTYHVVPSPDNAWGGRQSDGTVTGIIGMVARREADFAVTFTGITENRESVTDFTFPYIQGKLRLFSRTPKERNRALAILSPFSSMVSMKAYSVAHIPFTYTASFTCIICAFCWYIYTSIHYLS